RRYRSVHCGIAVAADQGLVVPVIHDAQDLSVAGLARRIDDCATRARERRLTIEDVTGGTITVNNTGAFGSIASRPILNHPEVANVTLERVVRRPVIVAGDSIAIRSIVNVCLTFDHRAFDGLEAGRFLAALRALLQGENA
ncbi:MAG: 2-oxo acid dehydrogenase subunit E2, partial [Dehalococcoidia bacterium]